MERKRKSTALREVSTEPWNLTPQSDGPQDGSKRSRYRDNPEYREKQKQHLNSLYHTDPAFREKKLESARLYRQKKKARLLEQEAKSKENEGKDGGQPTEPQVGSKRRADYIEKSLYKTDPVYRKLWIEYVRISHQLKKMDEKRKSASTAKKQK